MTTPHALPPSLIRSVSGPGDPAEITKLWAGQLSRRLVQLRAILDLTRQDAPAAGETAGLDGSLAALAAIQRDHPGLVADLFSGPQVGAWAAHCLRRLLGRPGPTPLWVHLAHLGSVAAVAAIRSGTEVAVRVPVRSGQVWLPTLGRADVSGSQRWDLATCTPGDPIRLDGEHPVGWQPIRSLPAAGSPVPFDDADPYWRCFGMPLARRLDDSAVEYWTGQLAAAWAILAERHPDRLPALAGAIRCLVPLDADGPIAGLSATSRDAPGAVALSRPVTPERLAATLVHELQHFRLNALHDLVPLHDPRAAEPRYSPWRNDPRPAWGLLHATTAFLGVAEFWSREWPRAGRATELMYARTVRQLHRGHRTLVDDPALTPAGAVLVSALGEAIGRLPHTGIAEDIGRIATDLTTHHHALWRLRHLIPDPAEVAAFADAWRQATPFPVRPAPPEHVTATAPPGGDSPLFRLAAAWVEAPAEVRAAATDPHTFQTDHPGADPVDLPLLDGNYPEAHTTRLTQLTRDSAAPEAWASLTVAHTRLCTDPSRSPIATRPELVRAALPEVARTIHDPLAGLAARYVAGTSTSDSMRR